MSRILKLSILTACIFLLPHLTAAAPDRSETDSIRTIRGQIEITLLGHASLRMDYRGQKIYVDPCSNAADFSKMPKADIILFTHEHSDHFDMKAMTDLSNDNTLVVLTETCAARYGEGMVMKNGDVKIIRGLKVECVPAYNMVYTRPSGFPYHLKGVGNGYVITFGDKRVYVAGDTEKIPEMSDLGDIDIAFLPVSLPETMSVEMAADAVKVIKPKIFYPYNCEGADLDELGKLLKDQSNTEVRIRNMKAVKSEQ